MNTLTATRLGKVDAGEIQKTEKKLKENLAAPIILWSKDGAAAALYFSVEVNYESEKGKQTIDLLVPSTRGLKERLQSLTGAYPITYSFRGIYKDEDKEKLNNVSEIYTKDINGDGIDELIITREKGDIEVYDCEKRIMNYRPKSDPKLYKYKMNDVNFTNLGDHDEMFFTVEQDPYENKNRTDQDTWIVRVSPQGITEIHPVFPDHSKPTGVINVIGLNRPGSRIVDELVVVSEIKGRKGSYMSRHNLDGTGIDSPREIYTGYDMYNSAYGFSGSNQIIITKDQDKMLYFATPDKPVNWIKTIDQKKLFGSDTKSIEIGETVINNIAVLILEDRGKLYALDALGKFHTSMKPDSHISDTPVAFMTLKPDSDKHTIIRIQPADKTMESYLVIQSRDPGRRDLSLEELEKAGKRFLTDHDWKMSSERLNLDYRETTHELAESYCRRNKIPMPEIHSWEDIKKKLPGYYEQKVEESKRNYRSALEIRLLGSINEDYVPENNKEIEEFKKWLNSIYVAPELVVSIQHISKGNIGHQRLTDYYFKKMVLSNSGFSQPSINVQTNGEHGRAFMVLNKKLLNQKGIKPAYYTIAW